MIRLKKLISGLLMTALLFGCLAILPHPQAEAATVASGTCGDNLTWVLGDAGTLTISGTGPMGDYPYEMNMPWYDCRDAINSIVIEKGVTSIGNGAFSFCVNLTNVAIPDSVTSIGGAAFSGCRNLTTITIPSSVSKIRNAAFRNCSGLTSLQVADGNPVYHSIGNCIIHTSSKTLIVGCKNSQIPNDGTVTSIGVSAFQGHSSLTSITIPDDVTFIASSAFEGCTGLISITLPDNALSLGSSVFADCSSLASITIPSSIAGISGEMFSGCSSLTSLQVADGNPVYHSVGNCIVNTRSKTLIVGCKNSQIPTDGSVIKIDNFAFSGCAGLTSITIPDSVTSIGGGSFFGCTNLNSIVIPDSVTTIGDEAFSGCTGLTSITIPNSVTRMGGGVFSGCTGLTSVTISNTITWINSYLFKNCTGLTSITIPTSITNIGNDAFSGCIGLQKIYFDGGAPVVDDTAFNNVTATAYYYPDDTWTDDVMQNYGGNITWKAISSGQDVTISFEGLDVSGDPVTIQIFSEGASEATYEFSSADAAAGTDSWTVEGIAEGSYTVKVSKKNYVAREYPLTVGDEAAALDVELWLIGDVTGDGLVNFSDYSKVLSQSKNPTSEALTGYAFLCGDVTGDGIINFSDYSKILSQAKGNHTLW